MARRRRPRGALLDRCPHRFAPLSDGPEFLHPGSLGSSAQRSARYVVRQEGNARVHSNRWFTEGPCPPAFEIAFPTGGKPVESWTDMRWDAPSQPMLHVGATFTGQRRDDGMNAWAGHLLTPETETSTHDFYSHTRTHDLDSPAMDEILRDIVAVPAGPRRLLDGEMR